MGDRGIAGAQVAPPLSDITSEDDLKAIEANRVRIRSLGTLVGSSASLLVTISLAIAAYIYKAEALNTSAIDDDARRALFIGIGLAGLALVSVVLGFTLRAPYTADTRADLITKTSVAYTIEHGFITLGAAVLLVAVLFSAVGTWSFVDVASPKPSTPAAVATPSQNP